MPFPQTFTAILLLSTSLTAATQVPFEYWTRPESSGLCLYTDDVGSAFRMQCHDDNTSEWGGCIFNPIVQTINCCKTSNTERPHCYSWKQDCMGGDDQTPSDTQIRCTENARVWCCRKGHEKCVVRDRTFNVCEALVESPLKEVDADVYTQVPTQTIVVDLDIPDLRTTKSTTSSSTTEQERTSTTTTESVTENTSATALPTTSFSTTSLGSSTTLDAQSPDAQSGGSDVKGMATGPVVGLVVGAVIVGALLGVAGTWVWWRRRVDNMSKNQVGAPLMMGYQGYEGNRRGELSADSVEYYAPGGGVREIDGREAFRPVEVGDYGAK